MLRRALALEPALARLCVSARVAADEEGLCADRASEPQRLGDGIAAPDDEVGAPLAERDAQVVERVEQKRDAVRRIEAAQDRVVEDEERHDVCVRPDGLRQRGLIVYAQVACEEDDGGAQSRVSVQLMYRIWTRFDFQFGSSHLGDGTSCDDGVGSPREVVSGKGSACARTPGGAARPRGVRRQRQRRQ